MMTFRWEEQQRPRWGARKEPKKANVAERQHMGPAGGVWHAGKDGQMTAAQPLSGPNKALDQVMGPEQEVLHQSNLHLASTPWSGHLPLPIQFLPSPAPSKAYTVICLICTQNSPSPRSLLYGKNMGFGVRLGLSKSFNFKIFHVYIYTCTAVKREKYLPPWL